MSNKQTFNHFTNVLQQLNCDIAFIQDPTTISLLTHYTTDPHERVLAMVVSANHSPLFLVPALEKIWHKRLSQLLLLLVIKTMKTHGIY